MPMLDLPLVDLKDAVARAGDYLLVLGQSVRRRQGAMELLDAPDFTLDYLRRGFLAGCRRLFLCNGRAVILLRLHRRLDPLARSPLFEDANAGFLFELPHRDPEVAADGLPVGG